METYNLVLNKQPKEEFNRVHAILVTDDGRVLLRYKNGEARITGGRIELDETDLVETLRREVREEINVEIDKCDYIGYLEVEMEKYYDEIGLDCKVVREKEIWARMVARVAKIGEPKPDPDRENNWIYGRVLAPSDIALEELSKSMQLGDTRRMVLEALRVAKANGYFTEPISHKYEVLNLESYEKSS